MNAHTLIVGPQQGQLVTSPGAVLSIKDCSGPLTLAFDGAQPMPIFSGTVLNGPFHGLQFFNAGSVPVTVNFFTGPQAVNFAPAAASQSNSKSLIVGNLGVVSSGSSGYGQAVTTVPPIADNRGYLQVTDAMRLLVSGTRNGLRRQVLLISVDTAATHALNVLDASSSLASGDCAALTLQPGAQVELLTDSDVIFSGAGGTVGVTIGQIFLSNT